MWCVVLSMCVWHKTSCNKASSGTILLLCSDHGAIFYSRYGVKAILQKVITWVPKRSNRIPKLCVMSHKERVLCSIFCLRTHSWEAPKSQHHQIEGCIVAFLIFFVAVFMNQYLKSIKALLPLFFLTWWESEPNIGRCFKWLHELDIKWSHGGFSAA